MVFSIEKDTNIRRTKCSLPQVPRNIDAVSLVQTLDTYDFTVSVSTKISLL